MTIEETVRLMRLTEPWSPVGYQIVETQVQVPRKKPASAGPDPSLQKQQRGPSLPFGYRVTLVSEEPGKPMPVRHKPPQRPHRPSPKRAGVHWAPILLGGFFLFLAIYGAFLLSDSPRPAPLFQALAPAQQQAVVIPEEFAALAAVAPPNLADDQVRHVPLWEEVAAPKFELAAENNAVGVKRECEKFGTDVEFARNPREAGRLAGAQDKLTFILHVSGNFEDAGFT